MTQLDANLQMLKDLTDANGIPGNERAPREVMKKYIEPYADEIKISREKEAKQIEDLKASGMDIYTPTDEEIAAFQEAVQPIYDKYTDVWGADLLKAFQE